MQINRNSTSYILSLLAAILLFSSCEKEYEGIESIDDAKIKAYIQKNSIDAIKDPSGFYYQILDKGTGGPLLNKDSVFYTSVVKSLSGTTYYSPTEFSNEGTYLGYVNPTAYRTAMYTINRGGKVRVIVPSYLAFGKNGQGPVPANEVIVSDITVFPEAKQWQVDDRIILNFIATKGLTGFTKHSSRVYQNVSLVGTGGTVINPFSTIKVKYKGRLLNGTVFDESGTTDLENPLDNLIPGWRKVLIGVVKGTKLRILVPSDLAYGVAAQPSIPANSVLDFDIEIVDVTN